MFLIKKMLIFIKKKFEKDLVLFITKEFMPLSFVEAPFFRRLILRQNPQLNFPLWQKFKNNFLPMIIEQTKEIFVSLAFNHVIHALYLLIFRY
jgi:hypothetical protein